MSHINPTRSMLSVLVLQASPDLWESLGLVELDLIVSPHPAESSALFCPFCGTVWARISARARTRWHALHAPCTRCGGTGQVLPHITSHRVLSVSPELARYELKTFNRNHPGRDLWSAG